MRSELHIENIEEVLQSVSKMLDVSFEIRDSQGHFLGGRQNEKDNHQAIYRELFNTITTSEKPHMIKSPYGETIWGIPVILDNQVLTSFIVIHQKPSDGISLIDSDVSTTKRKIKQIAEQAIIKFVEDVLHLLSYRHESEKELDLLAEELSIRYEELNFFYTIGARVGTVEDFDATLYDMLSKTIEIVGADYAGIHIPSKNIVKNSYSNLDKNVAKSLTQKMVSVTPELFAIFQKEVEYLTDSDLAKYPFLKPLMRECKCILAIPVTFDKNIQGIFILGRNNGDTAFSIGDKRLMNVVSDMLAIKITNTELFQELKNLSLNLMKSFTETIEEKDPYTRGHSERVNEWSLKIGAIVGLNPAEMETLNIASILHDIGKVGISEDILNKPGKLSNEEYDIIKLHPLKGYKILNPISQLKACLPSILYHHERIDGNGYPQGLSGTEIPLLAKIIAVADTFDAMTTHRAYRNARKLDDAVLELLEVRGKQLDREITNIFISKCLGIKIEDDRIQKVKNA